jgi:translation initiation factor IF-3
VVNKFVQEVGQWGHPDFQPKLIGRGINLMISPLPRNKRAKNPNEGKTLPPDPSSSEDRDGDDHEDAAE